MAARRVIIKEALDQKLRISTVINPDPATFNRSDCLRLKNKARVRSAMNGLTAVATTLATGALFLPFNPVDQKLGTLTNNIVPNITKLVESYKNGTLGANATYAIVPAAGIILGFTAVRGIVKSLRRATIYSSLARHYNQEASTKTI